MSYSSEVLADSPLVYWRLGEASSPFADSSGNGRTATASGGVTPGQPGLLTSDLDDAASFDGSSGYVDAPFGSWQNASAFSVEALISPSSVSGTRTIMSRQGSGADSTFTFRLEGNRLRLYIWRTSTLFSSTPVSSATFTTGNTYHVVGTFDAATGVARLYVNGALDTSATLEAAIYTGNTTTFKAGGRTAGEYYAGIIDEPAFYGTVLSGERIAAHYTAATTAAPTTPGGSLAARLPALTGSLSGIYTPPEGGPRYPVEVLADTPLAYYRLGEASGTTMTDSSGNGRHGAYFGSPTLGAPGLLVGDTNTCADFTGSNYGDVPHGSWMDVPTITLEAVVSLDSIAGSPTLIDRDSTSGRLFQFRVNGGKIEWLLNVGGVYPNVVAGSTSLTTGTVYHLAGTFDGTTAKVYVNGSLDGSLSVAGSLGTGTSPLAIAASRGGNYADTSGPDAQRVDGKLDEVAVYGVALSAARIAAHYAAATGATSEPTGSLVVALPTVGADLAGTYTPPVRSGSFAVTLPAVTASLAGTFIAPDAPLTGSLAATLPAVTAALAGTYVAPEIEGATGSLAATLPALTATIAGAYVAPEWTDGDLTYANQGYNYTGTARVFYDPPVAPEPAGVGRAKVKRVHQSLPSAPTLVDGRPTW